MKQIQKILLIILLISSGACGDYLDLVPDNVATIDNAFTLRNTAEKFLFTCYSYLPDLGAQSQNPGLYGADELWTYMENVESFNIAMGFQNVVNPYNNYWDGQREAKPLFNGIRDCNIFLENIGSVPDLEEYERVRWIAEVKFLKAYYHFYLLRMYGPIPVIRENLPISTDLEELQAQMARVPVDEGIAYIVQLLDEAAPNLPEFIESETTELGRITKPIALSIKARVLVMAASPFFNGNTDYAGFTDHKGQQFFNQSYDPNKWQKAVDACKGAIDAAHAGGHKLYYYSENNTNSVNVSVETQVKMNIRNSLCAKWNPEIVWGASNSGTTVLQRYAQARLDASTNGKGSTFSAIAPTLKMAELFYTENGVPIDEDKMWDYAGRYGLKTATVAEQYNIVPGYETAALHFNRESRFYADLGFDGGIWFGQGKTTDANNWHVEAKPGQYSGISMPTRYSITGYWAKKLVNVENVYSANIDYTIVNYPWPVIRLADIYLLYAESLNELNGPGPDVYNYLNVVRERAGLGTVQDSWSLYSTNPAKYTTKEGLREIIHQERSIEMAFEGQRIWDLKRWKRADEALNSPVQGWDIHQENAADYYQVTTIYEQTFEFRDYLWPIKEQNIIANKTLGQNPGW